MNFTKLKYSCRGLTWMVLAFGPLWLSCGKETNTQSTGSAPPAKSSGTKGLVIEGERFTTRVVQDPVQKLPLCVFAAPEKWKDKSGLDNAAAAGRRA